MSTASASSTACAVLPRCFVVARAVSRSSAKTTARFPAASATFLTSSATFSFFAACAASPSETTSTVCGARPADGCKSRQVLASAAVDGADRPAVGIASDAVEQDAYQGDVVLSFAEDGLLCE